MDLEPQFPHLAAFARSFRTSLADMASNSKKHDGYLTLRDACWIVQSDFPRHSHADATDYLATIDAYLEHPWEHPPKRKELWRKISTGNESMFLDTISELAWGLHFRDRRITFVPEARLFEERKRTADADFLIGPPTGGLWLDVTSVQLTPLKAEALRTPRAAYPRYGKEALIQKAVDKARNKFENKFREAVTSGRPKGQAVGILLGFPKAEQDVIPSLVPDLLMGGTVCAPEGLFGDEWPDLALVWGFTLTRATKAPYLLPGLLFPWRAPEVASSAFLDWLSPALTFMTMKPCPYDFTRLDLREIADANTLPGD